MNPEPKKTKSFDYKSGIISLLILLGSFIWITRPVIFRSYKNEYLALSLLINKEWLKQLDTIPYLSSPESLCNLFLPIIYNSSLAQSNPKFKERIYAIQILKKIITDTFEENKI